LSPIERQLEPPSVDSHTPPVAGAAKIRPAVFGSYANDVIRPDSLCQPSRDTPLF